MTGLGVRSSSNGSLEKTGLNGVVLSIQTTRAKPSKMHKEREGRRICKLAGRKKVGMLLLFLISAVVFLRVLFVGKGEDGQVPPSLHFNGTFVVNHSYMLPTNEEETISIRNISFLGLNAVLSPPMHFLGYTLPQGHPCNSFTLPPPPADRKRTGPRSCPVCYLPVEEAIALMPNAPSFSPLLKNLTYIYEEPLNRDTEFGGSDFGGYPTLKHRNDSFEIKETMSVHCGFVKGPQPGRNTGFDIDEADLLEMKQCPGIVVASAVFDAFDDVKAPQNISKYSEETVCFYMFVDEETESILKRERGLNGNKKVGIWRVVVVHNLPYSDGRRNGKVPKLLVHRMFPNARYSLWIDGKLELVVDPHQILERFLWRKNATFAISKHYKRFDVLVEAEANKAAGKYDNASIDFQVEFYKNEGLTPLPPTHTHDLMTLMPLTFSSSIAVAAAAAATVTSSPRFSLVSLRGFKKLPLRCALSVRAMSELVQDKESVVAATTSSFSNTTPTELNHSRTFLDARTEEDLISGLRKEIEAGRLPPNVASGMEELFCNYKNAVLSSGAPRAAHTVISNMSVAFDRMLLGVEHPFTFNPYHKAIREPFDYYQFVHTYIRPLIDFKNSYVGNVSLFSELEDKIRQGHNIVLISNHQSEADPAVISLLLEAQCPYIGENIKCVAGDRVITDPLCKPFSMGRNLICVYSKKHMNDDPELVDMKRKANTRSLKEMAKLLRSGSQLIWIAPSGGRDRPDPSTGEWFPAPFDPSSVDNMRRLVEHSGAPGHIYPMSLLCYDIMPPPPKVEKEIGEKRLVGFHGTGLSIAPEISFSDVTADCNNPNEAKEAYSQAMHKSVNEQYKTLNSAINHGRGIEASTSTVSLSQPWN